MIQAPLGYTSEDRFLRYALKNLLGMFAHHLWSADVPAKPRNAPTWPDGPSTATAPRHSRFFWTPALAHGLATNPARQIVIGDKNYYGRAFEADLDTAGIDLLRPARKGEKPRPGQRFFKPLRNASSLSPPPSGTTTASTHPSYAPSPPTTTEHPLEFFI